MEVDQGGRSLGKQIKICNAEKIPLFAVVGKEEVEGRSLALKSRKKGDMGSMGLAEAISHLATASEGYVEP